MTTHEEPATSNEAGELAALVARAAQGEERAWEELLAIYSRRVYALVRSRLRRDDLAEEITQSVFVTVATKLRDQAYSEVGRFEPWLFRIAMNRVRDRARSMKRRATVTDPTVLSTVAAPDGAPDRRAEMQSLRSAMESLSDQDREVVELRHHGQMGFKQIADLLGEPVGTVLARHHRALRKLRATMESSSGPSGEDES